MSASLIGAAPPMSVMNSRLLMPPSCKLRSGPDYHGWRTVGAVLQRGRKPGRMTTVRQQPTFRGHARLVRFTQQADNGGQARHVPDVPKAAVSNRSNPALTRSPRRLGRAALAEFRAQDFRCLQVDDQLVLGRCLHWEVGWLLALQN